MHHLFIYLLEYLFFLIKKMGGMMEIWQGKGSSLLLAFWAEQTLVGRLFYADVAALF